MCRAAVVDFTCFERSSLQSVYKVINFLASTLASRKPSATSIISQINSKSGTTIAQGLRKKENKNYDLKMVRKTAREYGNRIT